MTWTQQGVGVGEAHAKTILIGEHAVVYRHPAIAFPMPNLSLRATARLLPYPDGQEAKPGTIEGHLDAVGFEPMTASYSLEGGLTLDVPSTRTGEHSGRRRVATVGDPSTGAIYVDLLAESAEDELAQSALRTILAHVGEKPGRAEVHVEGTIPTARGLGSSAAMSSSIAVAVARLYGQELSTKERFDIVQFVERIAHGTPSGLDAYATMASGPLWFVQGQAEKLEVAAMPPLLVADTGLPGRTLDAVRGVREHREREPERVNAALARIGELAWVARDALGAGEHEAIGRAMNETHEILSLVGVSHPALDHLVESARSAGACGAKLTGGGQGGCIIALAPSHEALDSLETALHAAGAAHVWRV